MKLCATCNGLGFVAKDVCETCNGEGLNVVTTFVVGKQNRRKGADFSKVQEEKKHKIDKKNATRGEVH